MAQVIWTPGALSDINDIASYIALDSSFHAGQQVLRILSAEDLITQFPGGGRMVPEMRNKAFREVILPPYRVIYQFDVRKDVAGILAVIHSRRLLRGALIRRLRA
ncbi:MAG: type II toxin-antitoxin system RelE/ParE family toxin [Flavobacteriales bacterium]|nr:type II toxin-antitoxin system RelE/ParE family toxin [Flavobacteriales bacterium]